MTDHGASPAAPYPSPAGAPPAGPPIPVDRPGGRLRAQWFDPAEVRSGVALVAVLAVLGAVLGVVWELWSPTRPRAYVIVPGKVANDTTEAFVASDGRYAFLAALVGVLSALLIYLARRSTRGPVTVAALAVGNLAGSLLMWGVGRLLGGGSADGRTNTLIQHTTLTVHADGLVFLQAGVAVLIYGVLVSFARDDDLGRPDPGTGHRPVTPYPYPATVHAPAGHPATGYPPAGYPPVGPSVGVDVHPQYPGGDPHAAGPPQQGGLPVQDPRQQQ